MYHYTECGIDGIWLANGYETIDTPYGEATAVHDPQGLHHLIALDLVNGKPRLTGADLRFLRGVMDRTQAEVAELVGREVQAVARAEKGDELPPLFNRLIRQIVLEDLGESPRYTDLVQRVLAMDPDETPVLRYREGADGWEHAA